MLHAPQIVFWSRIQNVANKKVSIGVSLGQQGRQVALVGVVVPAIESFHAFHQPFLELCELFFVAAHPGKPTHGNSIPIPKLPGISFLCKMAKLNRSGRFSF